MVVELFRRALTGCYTCRELANWLNSLGLTTRNRKRSAAEEATGEPAKPRKFTADSVQGILGNPFYAGFIVRQRRSKNGTPSRSPEVRQGGHRPAVSPEDFNCVQSISRAHYKAPRSALPRLRPYLGKGPIKCWDCSEIAWCQYIQGEQRILS